jgi:hypothetical protein
LVFVIELPPFRRLTARKGKEKTLSEAAKVVNTILKVKDIVRDDHKNPASPIILAKRDLFNVSSDKGESTPAYREIIAPEGRLS